MTQEKLLFLCFALAAAVNTVLFFIDGFPNYANAALGLYSGVAAYLIKTKLCRGLP